MGIKTTISPASTYMLVIGRKSPHLQFAFDIPSNEFTHPLVGG
jgi:hypothetical protein